MTTEIEVPVAPPAVRRETKLSDLLLKTKALIDRPWKWCKHRLACKGLDCDEHCLEHAILLATGDDGDAHSRVYNALDAELPDNRRGQGLWLYNDLGTTTHADIVALFDRAVEKAQAREMWAELQG